MRGRLAQRAANVKVASAARFVDTEDDQNERCCHEHPAWMTTARRPKVAESAKQVSATNEEARRASGVPIEPDCSGEQGEASRSRSPCRRNTLGTENVQLVDRPLSGDAASVEKVNHLTGCNDRERSPSVRLSARPYSLAIIDGPNDELRWHAQS
jgi:hypothetical protein